MFFSSEHGDDRSLNWNARVRVALGSARGLAYLHHDCCPRIVHRDIKSSNILLDENLEPHVSDFGLAKLLVDEDAHVTTVVAGTFGYLAPGMSNVLYSIYIVRLLNQDNYYLLSVCHTLWVQIVRPIWGLGDPTIELWHQ